jgi:hypothetical protein
MSRTLAATWVQKQHLASLLGIMPAVDWSAVTPAAITGAVGIAGVAGTVLSARISARSTSERERVAEKRRIYAQYFRVAWELTAAYYRLGLAAKSGASEEQWSKAVASVDEIEDVLRQASTELILIASFTVAAAAGDIERHYQRSIGLYRRSSDSVQQVQEELQDLSHSMRELEKALRNAMRKDLGAEAL